METGTGWPDMIAELQQEQACLYALGALGPDETAAFEQELRDDDELQTFTRLLQKVSLALALDTPSNIPPAELKARLLAALPAAEVLAKDFSPTETPRVVRFAWLPWALAACVTVLCGVLAVQKRALREESIRLGATVQQQQSRLTDLQNDLAALSAKDQVSQLHIALLGSLLESAPQAVAVSLWDAEKQKGVLVVQNLTPLPTDQDYQLWVIDPQLGSPVDAGVFSVDAKGAVRFRFQPKTALRRADKFAVTLEKKGGVPAPQGPMVLAGTWL